MNKHRFQVVLVASLLIFSIPLQAQDESKKDVTKEVDGTQMQIREIIKLAESKLYSPLRDGVNDLYFVHELALEKQARTYWFKAPDKKKGIFGIDRPMNDHEKKYAKLFKRKSFEQVINPMMVDRVLGKYLGTPISCLLPYGTFEIIKKDEEGTQLRFTCELEDITKIVWKNIDFYLDAEFLLYRSKQRLMSDNRVEENVYTLKPYKEGAELMVVSEEVIIAGAEGKESRVKAEYRYSQIEGACYLTSVKFFDHAQAKQYEENYTGHKINQGIDDAVFEIKE